MGRRAAQRPLRTRNVAAKISGLNTIARGARLGAPDDLREAVAVAVDAFGPDRLVCGSDWPVALLNGELREGLARDACA